MLNSYLISGGEGLEARRGGRSILYLTWNRNSRNASDSERTKERKRKIEQGPGGDLLVYRRCFSIYNLWESDVAGPHWQRILHMFYPCCYLFSFIFLIFYSLSCDCVNRAHDWTCKNIRKQQNSLLENILMSPESLEPKKSTKSSVTVRNFQTFPSFRSSMQQVILLKKKILPRITKIDESQNMSVWKFGSQ